MGALNPNLQLAVARHELSVTLGSGKPIPPA
jgi:hypothetical protein